MASWADLVLRGDLPIDTNGVMMKICELFRVNTPLRVQIIRMDLDMKRRLILLGVLVAMMVTSLSGCAIWESNGHPDYQSTRADYLCHPYGNCSGGNWVPLDPLKSDQPETATAYALCTQEIDRGHEDGWWRESVTRGLEIGECMQQLGFRLQE